MKGSLLLHPTNLDGFALFLLSFFWYLAFDPVKDGTAPALGLCTAFEDFIWFEAVVIKRSHELHFMADHFSFCATIGLREDN